MGRSAKGSRLAVRPLFVFVGYSASVFSSAGAAYLREPEPAR